MKKNLIFIYLLLAVAVVSAQDKKQINYLEKKDVSYIEPGETDSYKKERCKVDIYYPENLKEFPTIVYFHGGGLEGGGKHIPDQFKNKGFAVVTVNYRLSPKAKNPAYIEDAAQAVAWTMKNISSYGGSADKIFLSGHSAGGYLDLIVGLDKSYLAAYNADADKLAGLLPISGQTNTHYTIRKERGLPNSDIIPVIDEYAPIYHSRKTPFPIVLITGDRNLEMTSRWEENVHLASVLKAMGNDKVTLYEVGGFDHGTVYESGCILVMNWLKKYMKDR